MFGHKHYVPILKTKAGELWAIDRTTVARKQHITPLFELHRHKSKADGDHVADICDTLASNWGGGSPIFLDTCWLHDANGDADTLSEVFAITRSGSLTAVPVVRLSFDQDTIDAVSDIVAEDDYGCMLRLSQNELHDQPRIAEVVNRLGIGRDKIDLLIDYRTSGMHLPTHVPSVPNVSEWRTFIAASSAFPRSVADLALSTWHNIDRTDWNGWIHGITSPLPRKPAFGDYALRDPGRPAEGGKPIVNLRYTKDQHWMVRRDRHFQSGFSTDMHAICQSLVSLPAFDGRTFSDGDAFIHDCANMIVGPGNPQQWLQWGMNHHIAKTVEQLLALP